jgi:hypothetical protein
VFGPLNVRVVAIARVIWHSARATCDGMPGTVFGMSCTPRHQEAEARFRELLQSAELPGPDEVGYEPDSVVFYWHDPKLAVFVDFEDDT